MEASELATFVEGEGDTLLDWRYKGFSSLPEPLTVRQVRAFSLPLHDLATPMMTIDASAVAENLTEMAAWCQERGLKLAPHGKTTMAPVLWLGQLSSGCVGITVANAGQLRAARAFGVTHIQLAGELVNPADIRWVAAEIDEDSRFRFLCWVDSVEAVERMSLAVPGDGSHPQIPVCVEVGVVDGRTGARRLDDVLAVARAVADADGLVLAGVSGYEGAVPGAATDARGLAEVDRYLRQLVEAHQALTDLYETSEVTVTAGGSAYFDRVAAILGPLAHSTDDRQVEVVLRSGAYVVHDDLHYRQVTPSTRVDGPLLRAAIHVWATVISRPQPDLVILDAGRRDLPFDLDLPVVLSAGRARWSDTGDSWLEVTVGRTETLRLNDQHAFVRVEPASRLVVGDVVKLGLSHPCTAFDKWRAIAVVKSADVLDPQVSDVALTYF
jgi:D-serine deaminase-like pyridoxal phosphate-dependent protein